MYRLNGGKIFLIKLSNLRHLKNALLDNVKKIQEGVL